MSFKICTIGCGDHASTVHGPSYKRYAEENPDVEFSACCDLNEEKAEVFQKRFGFQRHYRDLKLMLDTEKPDAVCLVSPVEYTAELASGIMRMGYPLILEKPPGRNKAEVMMLVEEARKNNVPNMVAFNRRYTPMIAELRKRLGSGFKPEELQNIRYDMYRVNRRDEDFATTAVHGIDAVRYIMDADYKSIRFHYQDLPQLGKGVKNIYMDCIMTSGAAAHLNFCPVAGVVIERCSVNAYNHTFMLDTPMWKGYDDPGRLVHLEKGKVVEEFNGDDVCDSSEMFVTGGFFMENCVFLNDIRAGRKPAGDLKTTVQSVEVQECITKRMAEYNA
jgi:predicted dehydrogenase